MNNKLIRIKNNNHIEEILFEFSEEEISNSKTLSILFHKINVYSVSISYQIFDYFYNHLCNCEDKTTYFSYLKTDLVSRLNEKYLLIEERVKKDGTLCDIIKDSLESLYKDESKRDKRLQIQNCSSLFIICFDFSEEEISNSKTLSILFHKIDRFEIFVRYQLMAHFSFHYVENKKLKILRKRLLDELDKNYSLIEEKFDEDQALSNIIKYSLKSIWEDDVNMQYKLIITGLKGESAINIIGQGNGSYCLLDKYDIRGRRFNIQGNIEMIFSDKMIHENDLLYILFTKYGIKEITLELLNQVTIDNLYTHPVSKLIDIKQSIIKNDIVLNEDFMDQYKLFINTLIDNTNILFDKAKDIYYIKIVNEYVSVRSEFGFVLRNIVLEQISNKLAEIVTTDENISIQFQLKDIENFIINKFAIHNIFINLNKLKFKTNNNFKLIKNDYKNISIDMSEFYDSFSQIKSSTFEEFFKQIYDNLSNFLKDNSFKLTVNSGGEKNLEIHSKLILDINRVLKGKTLFGIMSNLKGNLLPNNADEKLLDIYNEFFTAIIQDSSRTLIVYDSDKCKNYIIYPAYKNVFYRIYLERFLMCLDSYESISYEILSNGICLDNNWEFIDL